METTETKQLATVDKREFLEIMRDFDVKERRFYERMSYFAERVDFEIGKDHPRLTTRERLLRLIADREEREQIETQWEEIDGKEEEARKGKRLQAAFDAFFNLFPGDLPYFYREIFLNDKQTLLDFLENLDDDARKTILEGITKNEKLYMTLDENARQRMLENIQEVTEGPWWLHQRKQAVNSDAAMQGALSMELEDGQ